MNKIDIELLVQKQYEEEIIEIENTFKIVLTEDNKQDLKRRITIEVKHWHNVE